MQPFNFGGDVNPKSMNAPLGDVPLGRDYVAESSEELRANSKYPSAWDSLHTFVASKKKHGSFAKRTAVMCLLILIAQAVRVYITNLGSVVSQEHGALLGFLYPLASAVATFFFLFMTQHVIAVLDPMFHVWEMFMPHYHRPLPHFHQRFLLWLFAGIAHILGSAVGAAGVWGTQVDDTITHSGTPIAVSANVAVSFGLEFFGAFVIGWVFLHCYYDPEAWSDKNKTNAAFVVSLIKFALVWISIPYSSGCFSFSRYLGSSFVAWYWPPDGWVFAVGPAAGYGIACLLWYWKDRTTKDESVKSD